MKNKFALLSGGPDLSLAASQKEDWKLGSLQAGLSGLSAIPGQIWLFHSRE